MDLQGHREITRAAVEELTRQLRGRSPSFAPDQIRARRPGPESPAKDRGGPEDPKVGPDFFAVQRDLIDIVTLGHWRNHAQKHHFMRRDDGQTPYQGWTAACTWIETNLLAFADSVSRGEGGESLNRLGSACHAVEDSFARGHARRAPFRAGEPGAITHVYVYASQDSDEHAEGDEEWKRHGWVLELTKSAVVDLIRLAFTEADAARSGGVKQLRGWSGYRDRWLRASPRLQKQGGHSVDLIDAHTDGASLDEEGLGLALFTDLGRNTTQVTRVISRLVQHDATNADDVARCYVKQLRRQRNSQQTRTVANDRSLVALLLRLVETGGRTASDKNVAFLRQLR